MLLKSEQVPKNLCCTIFFISVFVQSWNFRKFGDEQTGRFMTTSFCRLCENHPIFRHSPDCCQDTARPARAPATAQFIDLQRSVRACCYQRCCRQSSRQDCVNPCDVLQLVLNLLKIVLIFKQGAQDKRIFLVGAICRDCGLYETFCACTSPLSMTGFNRRGLSANFRCGRVVSTGNKRTSERFNDCFNHNVVRLKSGYEGIHSL